MLGLGLAATSPSLSDIPRVFTQAGMVGRFALVRYGGGVPILRRSRSLAHGALLVALTCVLAPAAAQACSCSRSDPRVIYSTADAAFVGRNTDGGTKRRRQAPMREEPRRQNQMVEAQRVHLALEQ